MIFIYNLILIPLTILLSPYLLYRMGGVGRLKDRRGKIVFAKRGKGRIWIHGSSVGEMRLALRIAREIANPNRQVLITCQTHTAYRMAQRFSSREIYIYYQPFDFPAFIKRAMRRFKPHLIVILETEIWPNFLHQAMKRNINSIILNARLSEKSFKKMRIFKSLYSNVLGRVAFIGAQDEMYASRFRILGVANDRIRTLGSMKYDEPITSETISQIDFIQKSLSLHNKQVFVAGSIEEGEEHYIIQAYKNLFKKFPHLHLILCPRHSDQFDAMWSYLWKTGIPVIRRSSSRTWRDDWKICLLDTIGELKACYGVAAVAYVGGSLVPRGGHNIVEPAIFGVPILFGPYMDNFKKEHDSVLAEGGAIEVHSQAEIESAVSEILLSPEKKNEMSKSLQKWLKTYSGAFFKSIEVIKKFIPPGR